MATNGKAGEIRRHGAVRDRSQTLTPKTVLWFKGDAEPGKFFDVKQVGTPFQGVRRGPGE